MSHSNKAYGDTAPEPYAEQKSAFEEIYFEAKNERDLAKKERDLAKKKCDLAKKECDDLAQKRDGLAKECQTTRQKLVELQEAKATDLIVELAKDAFDQAKDEHTQAIAAYTIASNWFILLQGEYRRMVEKVKFADEFLQESQKALAAAQKKWSDPHGMPKISKKIVYPINDGSASKLIKDNAHKLNYYPLPVNIGGFICNTFLRRIAARFAESMQTKKKRKLNFVVPAVVQEIGQNEYSTAFQSICKAEDNAQCRVVLDNVFHVLKDSISEEYRPWFFIEKDSAGATAASVTASPAKPKRLDQLKDQTKSTTFDRKSDNDLPLSGTRTKTDPVLTYLIGGEGPRATLFFSEAKRFMHSLALCLPQACALAGDSVIRLRNLGVKLDHCVAMGILCAGNHVQIIGACLLPDAFPNFYILSRPLDRLLEDDLFRLTCWLEVMAEFAEDMAKHLESKSKFESSDKETFASAVLGDCWIKPVSPPRSLPHHKPPPKKADPKLPTKDGYIWSQAYLMSGHQKCLTRIMRVYSILKQTEAEELVLFPLGVAQLPEKQHRLYEELSDRIMSQGTKCEGFDIRPHTPLLVYPLLRSPWSNKIPTLEAHKSKYMQLLTQAVNACSEAGVVVMDLRPSNIMWRDSPFQLNLIDFEDVYPQGHVIDNVLIMAQMTDPYCRHNLGNHDYKNKRYFAHVRTNNWTLTQIRNFFESRDGYGSYEKYMCATNKGYYNSMEDNWSTFVNKVKKATLKTDEDEKRMTEAITKATASLEKEKTAQDAAKEVVTAS